jgi:hypothetical protein
MKRLALLLVLLWAAVPVLAQKPAVKPVWPFAQGEELVYEGEFTRALLRGVNVVDLKFMVVEGPPRQLAESAPMPATFRFTADAASKGALLKIFRQSFRQHFETTAEAATLAALLTKKEDIQNKRERRSEAVFDYKTGKLTWTEHNPLDQYAPPRVVASALEAKAFDLVSIWYHLRMQKTFTPGANFTLPVSDSGRVYQIPVRVGGRKTIKTVIGRVPAVQLTPEIFGDDKLIGGKGKLTLWLTDDARHIPVKGEISNNLGKLSITLKNAKL